MIKVALIGMGGVASAHIPAWTSIPDVELVALCDIHPEQMKSYPKQHHYTNFQEMLEQEEIDILDICLPTFLHVQHALTALNKGIHVLCEKPLSLHKEDIQKVYDTAAANNVFFMVAHVVRFWEAYDRMKEIYNSAQYGKLLSGSMTRLGGAPSWEKDGWMGDESRSGLIPFDLHIHDLDFLIYTFGRPTDYHSYRSKGKGEDYLSCLYNFGEFSVITEAGFFAAPYPFKSEFRFTFETAVVEY